MTLHFSQCILTFLISTRTCVQPKPIQTWLTSKTETTTLPVFRWVTDSASGSYLFPRLFIWWLNTWRRSCQASADKYCSEWAWLERRWWAVIWIPLKVRKTQQPPSVRAVSYGSLLSDWAHKPQPSLVVKYSFHLHPIDCCGLVLMMSHVTKCDDFITVLSCIGQPPIIK